MDKQDKGKFMIDTLKRLGIDTELPPGTGRPSSPIITCPTCGTKQLTNQGSKTTCAYYPIFHDADGNSHNHNGNRVYVNYICINHNAFSLQKINKCWCGWTQQPKE